MKYIMGIDPGYSGGVTLLNNKGEVEWVRKMPVIGEEKMKQIDVTQIKTWLNSVKGKVYVCVEKSQAIPQFGKRKQKGQQQKKSELGTLSSVAQFNFGKEFGRILGMLESNKIPFTLVPPQTWQKRAFEGMAKPGKNATGKARKERSIIACKRRFPKISLLATERSKVPHDGMADALLIAEYGLWKEGK